MTTDDIPYFKDGSPRWTAFEGESALVKQWMGAFKALDTDRWMRFEDARNIRRLYGLMLRKRAMLINDKDATAEDWQNAFEEIMCMVTILEETSKRAYGEVTAPPPKKLA